MLTEDVAGAVTLTVTSTNKVATLTLTHSDDIIANGELSVTVLDAAHTDTGDLDAGSVTIRQNCEGRQNWNDVVPDCLVAAIPTAFCSSPAAPATPPAADIATTIPSCRTQATGNPLFSRITPYSGTTETFRALASTATTSAINNTMTTGTGERIFYFNGQKVDDNYADLYDGSWDTNGSRGIRMAQIFSGGSGAIDVWTGSADDGSAHSSSPLGSGSGLAIVGNARSSNNTNYLSAQFLAQNLILSTPCPPSRPCPRPKLSASYTAGTHRGFYET